MVPTAAVSEDLVPVCVTRGITPDESDMALLLVLKSTWLVGRNGLDFGVGGQNLLDCSVGICVGIEYDLVWRLDRN